MPVVTFIYVFNYRPRFQPWEAGKGKKISGFPLFLEQLIIESDSLGLQQLKLLVMLVNGIAFFVAIP
jgi:hypothetical protein